MATYTLVVCLLMARALQAADNSACCGPEQRVNEAGDGCQSRGDVSEDVGVCPCMNMTCLNVCCPRGQVANLTTGSIVCEDAPAPWSDWSPLNEMKEGPASFLPWFNVQAQCPPGHEKYLLKEDPEYQVNIFVLANGSLLYQEEGLDEGLSHPPLFCLGPFFDDKGDVMLDAFVCLPTSTKEIEAEKEDRRVNTAVYCTLFVVGALFLLATLLVHAVLPELRRAVRGMALMAHCAFMFVAHVALVVVYLEGHQLPKAPCVAIGYVIQLSLMVGLFWMNVMCIDIALTFRSLVGLVSGGMSESKKFFYYALYATILPVVISLITVIADEVDGVPVHLKPRIGDKFRPGLGVGTCLVNHNTNAILLYFYGPMIVLLLFNLGLFIFTTVRILVLMREASLAHGKKLRRPERDRFLMFVKLFSLMGIPWVTEIISWGVGGAKQIWYLTDAINLLRAVLIFMLFCCKRKIWNSLCALYCPGLVCVVTPRRQDSMSTSGTSGTPRPGVSQVTYVNKRQDTML